MYNIDTSNNDSERLFSRSYLHSFNRYEEGLDKLIPFDDFTFSAPFLGVPHSLKSRMRRSVCKISK
jgi:hypothetical protein